jgi:hypothetical protein
MFPRAKERDTAHEMESRVSPLALLCGFRGTLFLRGWELVGMLARAGQEFSLVFP